MGFFNCLMLSFALCSFSLPFQAESTLPTIGDTSSSIVSQQKEQELGDVFLKTLYSQLATSSDPQLISYAENLVHRLAEASQLKNRQLSVVLIDSPNLNAFAAPGGIVGINIGLFLYARTEEEFAGVIAHELAHLSQRHYARGVEAAQRQRLPTMAALLGSIILAASGAGDAGFAALSSTIAGAQTAQLAFSRTNEQEADRIGILTMVRAGLDPHGMASLFERLSRLDGSGPQYEFLRTHPLSKNRVVDAKSRAEQFPVIPPSKDAGYSLMRSRAIVQMEASTPERTRNRFRSELSSGRTSSELATRYALALTELQLRDPRAAEKSLKPGLKNNSDNIPIQILGNRIRFASGDKAGSIARIRKLLERNPGNYPITMALVNLLMDSGQHQEALKLLRGMSRRRPKDPDVWYQIAEASGLAGNITGVHRARAEYYFLVGNMDNSIRHLEYAIEDKGLPFSQRAALRTRIEQVKAYKQKMKL